MTEQEEIRDDVPTAASDDPEADRPAEVDWDENEPTAHQGEEDQQPV